MAGGETQEFERLNFLKRIVKKVDGRVCQTVLLEQRERKRERERTESEREREGTEKIEKTEIFRIERHIPNV